MNLTGSCHCGRVKLTLPSAPECATECNCTLCRRLGARFVYYEFGSVRIEGREHEAEYIQGDRTLRTMHCTHCGVTTHWEPLEAEPGARHGVNLRLFEPELFAATPVRHFDGANSWTFLD
jgi:hypothetical protein